MKYYYCVNVKRNRDNLCWYNVIFCLIFREEVGDVTYVELFNDENDKPRGCGILEFATEEMAKRAVEKMHRHEFRGRKLVVKEVICV